MSRTRQPRRPSEPPVRCFAVTLPRGGSLTGIVDDWDRLVYASAGGMRVSTAAGEWMVPPHRAAWVPAGIPHGVQMRGRVALRTLYFRTDVSRDLPRECRVVNVSPLLRELILQVTRRAAADPWLESDGALVSLLMDQLRSIEVVPLQLPLPRDARALAAANLLRASPGTRRSLSSIGRSCGASARTLQRLFAAETGLTFERWRQRVRLARAVELLSRGRKVSAAASDVGYDSPSAFIAMFRRQLGSTPRAYLRAAAMIRP
ncbi:MAG TPA: helix-turn-helix transcriptional regulator [Thermoanaerobaculia bacterium]|nr:helix-turn-helix transcriptional regulator [Thermoanaerobaculia bacterium]